MDHDFLLAHFLQKQTLRRLRVSVSVVYRKTVLVGWSVLILYISSAHHPDLVCQLAELNASYVLFCNVAFLQLISLPIFEHFFCAVKLCTCSKL